jgi:hypothetical protein
MRRSRFITLFIPIALVLSVLLLYQRYSAVRAEIASVIDERTMKERTLRKMLSIIAEKPALEKNLAALKHTRTEENAKLTEGQTVSIVAAALQNAVKAAVTAKGGTISSERTGKVETFSSFKIVNVTIDAAVPDVRALADILYALETRTPYIVLPSLDVRIRNTKNPKELSVKLDAAAISNPREADKDLQNTDEDSE